MRGYEVDVGADNSTSTGKGPLQGGIEAGSVNTAAVAEESHNLLAFGTSLGTVEFFDSRSRERVGVLNPPWQGDIIEGRQEVTALQFHRSGLSLATGSSNGLVHLYDLRSPTPYFKKDQGYGYAIQDIIYLSSSSESRHQSTEPKILSADKRIIKIWDSRNGDPWTSVEPAVDIHSVAWCKDSGMLLTANEGRQQHSFFIPQLGPAPKWCAFLDNLVEEMAEDPNDPNAFTNQRAGEVYDNYKFLTPEQLSALNLSHLIGTTSLLRPYMHGYFVAQRLYEEAKIIADPFIWEEQRAKRVREKIDRERDSRIRGNKKVTTKINKRLAEKILEREEKLEKWKAQRVLENGGDEEDVQPVPQDPTNTAETTATPQSLLTDPRFAKLFQDEAFAIDETSNEFRSLNPSTIPVSTNKSERKLTAVEEELLDDRPRMSDESSEDSSDNEEDASVEPKTMKQRNNGMASSTSKRATQKPLGPQMTVTSSQKSFPNRDRSFGSRAMQKQKEKKPRNIITRSAVGEKEMTFAPKKQAKAAKVEPKQPRASNKSRRSASGNVFRTL